MMVVEAIKVAVVSGNSVAPHEPLPRELTCRSATRDTLGKVKATVAEGSEQAASMEMPWIVRTMVVTRAVAVEADVTAMVGKAVEVATVEVRVAESRVTMAEVKAMMAKGNEEDKTETVVALVRVASGRRVEAKGMGVSIAGMMKVAMIVEVTETAKAMAAAEAAMAVQVVGMVMVVLGVMTAEAERISAVRVVVLTARVVRRRWR